MGSIGTVGLVLGYILALVGDSCVLFAATFAASSGGRPLVWGTAFATAHAIFLALGLILAGEVAEHSHVIGHLVVIAALAYLLRHFVQHRHHDRAHHGECTCSHASDVTLGFIWTTAFGLSVHAIAGGAVLRQALGSLSLTGMATVALLSASLSGLLVYFSARFSERYRKALTRVVDNAPGLTVAILVAAILILASEAVQEVFRFSEAINWGTLGLIAMSAIVAGHTAHNKLRNREPEVLSIRRG